MAGIAEPYSMKNQHYSNIFCLSFNNDSSKIFSGGNDDVVIVHDSNTYVTWNPFYSIPLRLMWNIFFYFVDRCEPYDVFLHAKPVYGLSVDVTNDQIFATAGEDGHILIFDLRIGTQVLTSPKSRAAYHAGKFNNAIAYTWTKSNYWLI